LNPAYAGAYVYGRRRRTPIGRRSGSRQGATEAVAIQDWPVCDPAEVAALAREVMLADAEAYGNQFPAYREDPMRETLRAVEGLAADPGYPRRYGDFERSMVYGPPVPYPGCLATVRELMKKVAR
jgi:hypothetical protein